MEKINMVSAVSNQGICHFLCYGEIFGITQSGVLLLNRRLRSMSERNLHMPCDKFCANEDYLHYGMELMFLADFSLDAYRKEHGLPKFGRESVKCIVEMPKEKQKYNN